ncbi:MAG: hypothetical protein HY013_05435 [Candidatus Solibacter usitatus]|nr:hypothetical protein [Candidatus Solibacter usitatus]
MELLALADDLTGALEVGALWAARVTTELRLDPDVPALVIDTETRHLPAVEAALRVNELAREARQAGVARLFKKTDSTLRGNIGAELEAILSAWPGLPLIYAPAYPVMGRTVRSGVLYVNGVPVSETSFSADALNPVSGSFIPGVLTPQCGRPVLSITPAALRNAAPGSIHVCDGETEDDLEAVARGGFVLNAGPSGLAQHLFSRPPAPLPRVPCAAILNGSRHPVSIEQARLAQGCGWPVLGRDGGPDAQGFPALVVFGGDTAFAFLDRLGVRSLWPLGEVLPGVPISRFEHDGRRRYLITKAGASARPTSSGGFDSD